MGEFVKLAAAGIAAIVIADLAEEMLPAEADLFNLPVRKYGGAALGVYLAYQLVK